MDPTELWNQRVSELTAASTRINARVLRRYQELLQRVADGSYPVEAVEAGFTEYLKENGEAGSRALLESTVGLLAGLLYLEAKYREEALGDLIEPGDPIPPPPRAVDVDPTNWIRLLTEYASAQATRATERHERLAARIAAGEITPAEVSARGNAYVGATSPRFVGEVVGLGFDYAARAQASFAALAEGLYEHLLGPEPGDAPEATVVLELEGPEDSVASSTLVIENSLGESTWVECRISEFSSRGGHGSFAAEVAIEPRMFPLLPGDSKEVEIGVRLSRDSFARDTDHFAILRITGAGHREMAVSVVARATTSADDPVSSTS